MEDRLIEADVRTRLILSGMQELLDHGVKDFSLRRVAMAAQVSCAAPYRHFKDKEELIRAIIARIREDWYLLSRQIGESLEGDSRQLIIELCVAGVRFWNGGENFRSIMMSGYADTELDRFDVPLIEAVRDYREERGMTPEEGQLLRYTIRSLFYGTVFLISMYEESIDEALALFRERLERELP